MFHPVRHIAGSGAAQGRDGRGQAACSQRGDDSLADKAARPQNQYPHHLCNVPPTLRNGNGLGDEGQLGNGIAARCSPPDPIVRSGCAGQMIRQSEGQGNGGKRGVGLRAGGEYRRAGK